MKKWNPLTIGRIHFIGIGGIGMSGIAEVMHNLGYAVQGSDLSENANVKRLQSLGIPVAIGQRAENVADARVVVYSSAVKADNPEMVAARTALKPVVRRAEMLAELMRLKWCVSVAGTHGKTTTTSMVAALLDAADYDPTVINGGIVNAYGTNARLGQGDWMVVEADESDGTFVKLPATVAIITNIDPEHLDFYGDFETEKAAFLRFVENVPFYGFAALCIDHPEVQALIGRVHDRKIVTYGFSPQADIRGFNVKFVNGSAQYDVEIRDRYTEERRVITGLSLPMPGVHNVLNSLAAVAVAAELGMPDDVVYKAFAGFAGVKRRFTKAGVVNDVTVIDDYGHHPVEIAAVLKAGRQAYDKKVIAVVQPHRYTRLRSLFEEFCTAFKDADTVIVTEVYAAGEEPIDGISRDSFVEGLIARGHRRVLPLDHQDNLAAVIAAEAEPGDVVICLGAGSISAWANALPGQLDAIGFGQNKSTSNGSAA